LFGCLLLYYYFYYWVLSLLLLFAIICIVNKDSQHQPDSSTCTDCGADCCRQIISLKNFL